MKYTLFDDFITLQALLKELGITQSGGAIKSFLVENTVLLNGEPETRRGKKIRLTDKVELLEKNIVITLEAPTEAEKAEHLKDRAEKQRVATLVKELNKKQNKVTSPSHHSKVPVKKAKAPKQAIRFPGT